MPADPSPLAVPADAGELGIWCSGEEALRLTSFNADSDAVVTLTGRFRELGRRVPVPIGERHVPNTDRTAATLDIALGEGWLQGVSVIASGGSPPYGQTVVRVDLIRGRGASATVLQTILAGPVTAVTRQTWPGSPLRASIEGPGALRSIAGTNPAAGAEISETVPTGARWSIALLSAELASSTVAANREVSVVLDDGTTTLFSSPAGFSHTASLTRRYSAAAIGAPVAPLQGTDRQIVLPSVMLPAGSRVRTVTTNLDPADDWGAPQLLVEEWLEAQ